MFTPFFYLLKAKGLEVSLTEWLTFMEALDQGLSGASLTQFYYLGRMILVKSETDYDKYDRAFQEFFQGIKTMDEIPPQFMEWLENVEADEETMWDQENNILYRKNQEPPDEEEIRRRFQERLDLLLAMAGAPPAASASTGRVVCARPFRSSVRSGTGISGWTRR